jgi:hypothetical protein
MITYHPASSSSARGGHSFVVVSIADPSKFKKEEPNATLMVLCDRGTPIKYVVPLESTACGAHVGWLAEDIKSAIQEYRYMTVDPDAPSMADRNLSLGAL